MFSFKRGFFSFSFDCKLCSSGLREKVMKNEFENFLGTQKHQLEVKDFLRSLVFYGLESHRSRTKTIFSLNSWEDRSSHQTLSVKW